MKDGEKKYFTFAMTMPSPSDDEIAADRFMKAVSGVKGFYGVHVMYPYVLAVFDTLEGAVMARSIVLEFGEMAGNNIMYARVNDKTGTLIVGDPAWGKDAKKQ